MSDDAAAAVARTHEWFEHNSGWAPPDVDTLAEWVADGVCRAPDDCLVAPDGVCEHGLASWKLVLEALTDDAGHGPAAAYPALVHDRDRDPFPRRTADPGGARALAGRAGPHRCRASSARTCPVARSTPAAGSR